MFGLINCYLSFFFLCNLNSFCWILAETTDSGDGIPVVKENLISLGQINGKYFFYDKTNVTWFEGLEMCEDGGLTLAEVMNTAENEFLKSKFSPGNFEYLFWVGGRDAKNEDQFIWNNSEEKFIGEFYGFSGIRTCVLLAITDRAYNGEYYGQDCNEKRQVLCQTV